MASLHPTDGARLVLERERASDGEVVYRVSIYEPATTHTGTARLGWDPPAVAFEWQSEPPAWTVVFLERLLKGLPKKHADDGSWPRKITRWREERA